MTTSRRDRRRLTFDAHIISTGSTSYRLAHSRARRGAGQGADA